MEEVPSFKLSTISDCRRQNTECIVRQCRFSIYSSTRSGIKWKLSRSSDLSIVRTLVDLASLYYLHHYKKSLINWLVDWLKLT